MNSDKYNNLQLLSDILFWFYSTSYINEELEDKVFSLLDEVLCILCDVKKEN